MKYQIDARDQRTQEVRVGVGDEEVVVFRKVNFLIHNLRAEVEGVNHQLKLAAPWNGFRYRLMGAGGELASATKKTRMHAFDPDRPLIRHHRVEFELEAGDRTFLFSPEDRHGDGYVLLEGGAERGRLAMRAFQQQQGGDWQADLEAPDDWSVSLAAFVGWLAREGRSGMGS
jgi:hypothetical protein